jgi:hypothetical protein
LSKRRSDAILPTAQSALIDAADYLLSGGQMKSILMVTALLMSALAFAQEKQTPESKVQKQSAEQSQSPGNSQVEGINNQSDALADHIGLVIANHTGMPFDWTSRALKDKKGLCKVHHEQLRKATVPVLYGLTPGPPYTQKTKEKLFPNSLISVEAGCLVTPTKEAIVLQCQKCIEAKTKWANSKQ